MIQRNKIYRHYKGGLYLSLGTALHSETLEEMIIYQSLKDNKFWVRPARMWEELVDTEEAVHFDNFIVIVKKIVPRFKLLSQAEKNILIDQLKDDFQYENDFGLFSMEEF